MDCALGVPAPALQPFLQKYTGYRMEGYEPGVHRGLPSGLVTFIVSLDAPVDIAQMPDPRLPPSSLTAFVSGLHDSPAMIEHDGGQHGVSLDLTPFGVRTLFGMPASELAGIVVSLEDVLGRLGIELVERMREASTWQERFAAADLVLSKAMVGTHEPAPEIARAWDVIVDSEGTVEVGAVAKEVGWSRRHLSEKFRAELGISPKVAARVTRFAHSRRMLTAPGRHGLATIAAHCGYYDQAHLTREWNELAGCTPGTWLAEEELPSVQDDRAALGAA